jgi:hypothetical protein
VIGQAALVAAGLAAPALSWGPGSVVTAADLAGIAPDADIILMKLRGQGTARLLFPSHRQREGRRDSHPYRLPGPGVPIGVEVALSLAACAALCLAGRHPSRRPVRGGSGPGPARSRRGWYGRSPQGRIRGTAAPTG